MLITEKTEGCTCKLCSLHFKFNQHMRNVPEESKAFFTEIEEMLFSTKEDLSYARAIIDGSWPTADEVIAFKRKPKEIK